MLQKEFLADRWMWWRIADRSWSNPLDATFAERRGGRWNATGSFPTLYLNEDKVTARLNLRAFIAQWPYEPEDLRADTGPILVGATLPRRQQVCDTHSPAGVQAAGLPKTYPLDSSGKLVSHLRCQRVGDKAKQQGLRGVRTRSAQSRDGAGRELAWFPATSRSVAEAVETLSFGVWYWS